MTEQGYIWSIAKDEDIRGSLIRTLNERLKETETALNHYRWLEKVLNEDYDTAPSERIKKLI